MVFLTMKDVKLGFYGISRNIFGRKIKHGRWEIPWLFSVFMKTSGMNGGFSNKPWLITGGYSNPPKRCRKVKCSLSTYSGFIKKDVGKDPFEVSIRFFLMRQPRCNL